MRALVLALAAALSGCVTEEQNVRAVRAQLVRERRERRLRYREAMEEPAFAALSCDGRCDQLADDCRAGVWSKSEIYLFGLSAFEVARDERQRCDKWREQCVRECLDE